MAHHHLPCTPHTVRWGSFAASYPAVIEIEDGDSVTIDTLSGEPENLPPPPFTVLPQHRKILDHCTHGPGPHLVTGPVYVKGATVGQVLEVRIKDVTLRSDWGWNSIKRNRGGLPDDFSLHRQITIPINRETRRATLPWGGVVALRPFFGIMAVAPPKYMGEVSTIPPGVFGGNIDNRELVAGTTLYLPVCNEGGLFSAGDGHAVQGDGEVCLTALETSLTGTFEFHCRPDLSYTLPRAESGEHYITMGFDPNLDEAARIALRQMIEWLTALYEISSENAYRLCSLIGNLRVTQIVNGTKGIHMIVEKKQLLMALG